MSADTRPGDAPVSTSEERLAAVLDGQAEVFDEVRRLATHHRKALLAADIDTLTSLAGRAETLALRFRMLEEDRRRLEVDADGTGLLQGARQRLSEAVAGAVRDRSIAGALLERSAQHTEALSRAFGLALSGSYLPDGAPARTDRAGRRLSKEV